MNGQWNAVFYSTVNPDTDVCDGWKKSLRQGTQSAKARECMQVGSRGSLAMAENYSNCLRLCSDLKAVRKSSCSEDSPDKSEPEVERWRRQQRMPLINGVGDEKSGLVKSAMSSSNLASFNKEGHNREHWKRVRSLSRENKIRQEARDQQLRRCELEERQRRERILAERKKERDSLMIRFLREPLRQCKLQSSKKRRTKSQNKQDEINEDLENVGAKVRATKSVPDLEEALRIVRGEDQLLDIRTQAFTSPSKHHVNADQKYILSKEGRVCGRYLRTYSLQAPPYPPSCSPNPAGSPRRRILTPPTRPFPPGATEDIIRENQKPYPTRPPEELIARTKHLRGKRAADCNTKMGKTTALSDTYLDNVGINGALSALADYKPPPDSHIMVLPRPRLNRRNSMPDLREFCFVSSPVVYETIAAISSLADVRGLLVMPPNTPSSKASSTAISLPENLPSKDVHKPQKQSPERWMCKVSKRIQDDTRTVLAASPLIGNLSRDMNRQTFQIANQSQRKEWLSRHTSIKSLQKKILPVLTDTASQTDISRPFSALIKRRNSVGSEGAESVYYDSLEEDDSKSTSKRSSVQAFYVPIKNENSNGSEIPSLPPRLTARLEESRVMSRHRHILTSLKQNDLFITGKQLQLPNGLNLAENDISTKSNDALEPKIKEDMLVSSDSDILDSPNSVKQTIRKNSQAQVSNPDTDTSNTDILEFSSQQCTPDNIAKSPLAPKPNQIENEDLDINLNSHVTSSDSNTQDSPEASHISHPSGPSEATVNSDEAIPTKSNDNSQTQSEISTAEHDAKPFHSSNNGLRRGSNSAFENEIVNEVKIKVSDSESVNSIGETSCPVSNSLHDSIVMNSDKKEKSIVNNNSKNITLDVISYDDSFQSGSSSCDTYDSKSTDGLDTKTYDAGLDNECDNESSDKNMEHERFSNGIEDVTENIVSENSDISEEFTQTCSEEIIDEVTDTSSQDQLVIVGYTSDAKEMLLESGFVDYSDSPSLPNLHNKHSTDLEVEDSASDRMRENLLPRNDSSLACMYLMGNDGSKDFYVDQKNFECDSVCEHMTDVIKTDISIKNCQAQTPSDNTICQDGPTADLNPEVLNSTVSECDVSIMTKVGIVGTDGINTSTCDNMVEAEEPEPEDISDETDSWDRITVLRAASFDSSAGSRNITPDVDVDNETNTNKDNAIIEGKDQDTDLKIQTENVNTDLLEEIFNNITSDEGEQTPLEENSSGLSTIDEDDELIDTLISGKEDHINDERISDSREENDYEKTGLEEYINECQYAFTTNSDSEMIAMTSLGLCNENIDSGEFVNEIFCADGDITESDTKNINVESNKATSKEDNFSESQCSLEPQPSEVESPSIYEMANNSNASNLTADVPNSEIVQCENIDALDGEPDETLENDIHVTKVVDNVIAVNDDGSAVSTLDDETTITDICQTTTADREADTDENEYTIKLVHESSMVCYEDDAYLDTKENEMQIGKTGSVTDVLEKNNTESKERNEAPINMRESYKCEMTNISSEVDGNEALYGENMCKESEERIVVSDEINIASEVGGNGSDVYTSSENECKLVEDENTERMSMGNNISGSYVEVNAMLSDYHESGDVEAGIKNARDDTLDFNAHEKDESTLLDSETGKHEGEENTDSVTVRISSVTDNSRVKGQEKETDLLNGEHEDMLMVDDDTNYQLQVKSDLIACENGVKGEYEYDLKDLGDKKEYTNESEMNLAERCKDCICYEDSLGEKDESIIQAGEDENFVEYKDNLIAKSCMSRLEKSQQFSYEKEDILEFENNEVPQNMSKNVPLNGEEFVAEADNVKVMKECRGLKQNDIRMDLQDTITYSSVGIDIIEKNEGGMATTNDFEEKEKTLIENFEANYQDKPETISIELNSLEKYVTKEDGDIAMNFEEPKKIINEKDKAGNAETQDDADTVECKETLEEADVEVQIQVEEASKANAEHQKQVEEASEVDVEHQKQVEEDSEVDVEHQTQVAEALVELDNILQEHGLEKVIEDNNDTINTVCLENNQSEAYFTECEGSLPSNNETMEQEETEKYSVEREELKIVVSEEMEREVDGNKSIEYDDGLDGKFEIREPKEEDLNIVDSEDALKETTVAQERHTIGNDAHVCKDTLEEPDVMDAKLSKESDSKVDNGNEVEEFQAGFEWLTGVSNEYICTKVGNGTAQYSSDVENEFQSPSNIADAHNNSETESNTFAQSQILGDLDRRHPYENALNSLERYGNDVHEDLLTDNIDSRNRKLINYLREDSKYIPKRYDNISETESLLPHSKIFPNSSCVYENDESDLSPSSEETQDVTEPIINVEYEELVDDDDDDDDDDEHIIEKKVIIGYQRMSRKFNSFQMMDRYSSDSTKTMDKEFLSNYNFPNLRDPSLSLHKNGNYERCSHNVLPGGTNKFHGTVGAHFDSVLRREESNSSNNSPRYGSNEGGGATISPSSDSGVVEMIGKIAHSPSEASRGEVTERGANSAAAQSTTATCSDASAAKSIQQRSSQTKEAKERANQITIRQHNSVPNDFLNNNDVPQQKNWFPLHDEYENMGICQKNKRYQWEPFLMEDSQTISTNVNKEASSQEKRQLVQEYLNSLPHHRKSQDELSNHTTGSLTNEEEMDSLNNSLSSQSDRTYSERLLKALEARRLRRHRPRSSNIDHDETGTYRPSTLNALDAFLATLSRCRGEHEDRYESRDDTPSPLKSGVEDIMVQVRAGQHHHDVRVNSKRKVHLVVNVGNPEASAGADSVPDSTTQAARTGTSKRSTVRENILSSIHHQEHRRGAGRDRQVVSRPPSKTKSSADVEVDHILSEVREYLNHKLKRPKSVGAASSVPDVEATEIYVEGSNIEKCFRERPSIGDRMRLFPKGRTKSDDKHVSRKSDSSLKVKEQQRIQ
ncbi:hypothetical protein SK128_016260, partial [Halocaridina rubra]